MSYRVALMGWIGVDLFLILSGFLITGILYDAKGAPKYFRNFYVRRTLRIFPLYWAVVFIALAVLPNMPAVAETVGQPVRVDNAWTYWLYLANFTIVWEEAFTSGILIVAWSLAIEEQFYLAWAPVVRWRSGAALVRLCVMLIVAAFVLRLAMVLGDVHPTAMYVLPFARMDALAVGGFIALTLRMHGIQPVLRYARIAAPVAASGVVGSSVVDGERGVVGARYADGRLQLPRLAVRVSSGDSPWH